MSIDIDNLINSFLTPPKGKSPGAIKDRIQHWIDIANFPEKHVDDPTNRYAVAAIRRSARQNARKLIRRHPELALEIQNEEQRSASQEAA